MHGSVGHEGGRRLGWNVVSFIQHQSKRTIQTEGDKNGDTCFPAAVLPVDRSLFVSSLSPTPSEENHHPPPFASSRCSPGKRFWLPTERGRRRPSEFVFCRWLGWLKGQLTICGTGAGSQLVQPIPASNRSVGCLFISFEPGVDNGNNNAACIGGFRRAPFWGKRI